MICRATNLHFGKQLLATLEKSHSCGTAVEVCTTVTLLSTCTDVTAVTIGLKGDIGGSDSIVTAGGLNCTVTVVI